MPQPTQANIAPLVADVQERGRSVRVTFRCPLSGHTVSASHSMPRSNDMGTQMMNTAKRSMMYSLQSTLSQTIRSVFGHNAVGRVASDVTRQAVYSAARTSTNQNTLSARERQAAILAAFQGVAQQFVWDSNRGHWISSRAAQDQLSPFEQQLANHPVSHQYDRGILARMLVEIARADGRLTSDENAWLNDFLGPEMAAISDLANRPALSDAELNETTRGELRTTLMMLAWAMAIVDEHFDATEQAALQRFAGGLRLSNAQIQAARDAAQGYIIDQALERMIAWGGHDAHARSQLMALAGRIGMSEQDVQVAEARYQRRKGV